MSEWDCKHGNSHDLCPVCFRQREEDLEQRLGEIKDAFWREVDRRIKAEMREEALRKAIEIHKASVTLLGVSTFPTLEKDDGS